MKLAVTGSLKAGENAPIIYRGAYETILPMMREDGFKAVEMHTNISLTNGNPYRTSEGVMMNIYATAFRSNQIAFGAAKSVLFIIVLLAVSFGQMKLTSRNEVNL